MVWSVVVAVGLALVAGGEYFMAGLGLVLMGMCYARPDSSGGASELLAAAVSALGCVGALVVALTFAVQRFTG